MPPIMPMPATQQGTGGGMPPGQGGGTGAATTPQAMPGAGAQATTGVKLALEALQKSLVGIPMGSELHTAVLKAITDISKNLDKGGGGDQTAMIQQLAQMARGAQTQPPPQAAAMQHMFPGAGGGQPQAPAMQ